MCVCVTKLLYCLQYSLQNVSKPVCVFVMVDMVDMFWEVLSGSAMFVGDGVLSMSSLRMLELL